MKLLKFLILFLLVGCSSVSYNPTLENIAGNVHNCNMVEAGSKLSVRYKKCRNLELPTRDVDETSIWYNIKTDLFK